MRPRIAAPSNRALWGPQRVAIVGIYPCGKAQEPDKSERRDGSLSLSPNDLGSVLAVKGSGLPRSLNCAAGLSKEMVVYKGREKSGSRWGSKGA